MRHLLKNLKKKNTSQIHHDRFTSINDQICNCYLTYEKKGHYASIKEQTLKDLKALNKFHSLEEIREGMIIQFQLDQLPDAELAYLFGITIVAKTHFEDTVWNINKKMMVINKIVAQEIIELTRENYHIDNEITFFLTG